MAAVFNVFFDFGGSDATPNTEQNTDALGPPNVRFKTADDATVDNSNPIPIPDSGTKKSYWKQIYLKCNTAPDTQVDNVRFYSDGTLFGTGITLKIGDQFPTKNSGSSSGYEAATGTGGDSGDEMAANHAGLTSSSDLATKTSGSPLSVSISEAGSKIDAVGETTNYVVLQMEVGSSASSGELDNETLTFKYDEI